MCIIKQARFIKSSTNTMSCPAPVYPEYAFLGRSNVGKSSLLNMLVNIKNFARTSGTPGKTVLINHYLVNDQWYLVDLPGYGYSKTSKKTRQDILNILSSYLLKRDNLSCLFLLLDCRHEPQDIDLEFIDRIGNYKIPFVICFTKTDKLSTIKLKKNIDFYKNTLLQTWESLPRIFLTSSLKRTGRDEILDFISDTNKTIDI